MAFLALSGSRLRIEESILACCMSAFSLIPGNHRIQMHAGVGCFTIAQGTVVPNRSCIIQVRVEDTSTHCEHARSEGAKIIAEPTDHLYGERRYTTEDFYGHTWSFTEPIADVEPETWG